MFFHSNAGKYHRKDGKPSYKLVKKPSGEWAVEARAGGHVAWDEKKGLGSNKFSNSFFQLII